LNKTDRSFNIFQIWKKNRFVAYLRVSTRRQGASGLGLQAQQEIIQKHLNGDSPIAEFIEVESGRKYDRPKLHEALELCKKEKATLVVAKMDRLSRNVAFTSQLLDSGIEIVFCDFPKANRLVLTIISAISEYEAGLIRQRTKAALQVKKEQGCQLGKPENLMQNMDKAIANSRKTNQEKARNNPNNKRAVAILRGLANKTTNYSEMARVLNDEGFLTSRGGRFSSKQVSILLNRYQITPLVSI
jgi:DNA invertase Pin-like site-specific DNA recombinase